MSDKINRLIQQANIDKERAERLLEEIQLMDEQIADLTRELAEARDKALEEAAKVAETFEDLYAEKRDGSRPASTDFYANNTGSYASMDIAAAIRALKEKP